jgi:hypothetical protein
MAESFAYYLRYRRAMKGPLDSVPWPMLAFVADNDAQLVAGDGPAPHANKVGRPVLAFDDTDEEAALSVAVAMPGNYAGGTLKATLYLFAASDASNGCVFDVGVEAVTPNADTLDLEAADGWDALNSSGDIDLSGTTAGDLVTAEVTLTNKDSAAAGDLIRIGVRRDTDHANDAASGDIYLAAVEIWEST